MKTDAIVILDGFGYREQGNGNAVKLQGTPYIDSLKQKYPNTLIDASERAVGLPVGQMGNSEVGHLNLGAGRVVYQDITMIDKAIEDGDFFENEAFLGAVENCKKNGSALHLVGLLSDGGVHSMNTHLYALLTLAKKNGLKTVYVHCVTDGRDVPPDSAANYIAELEKKIKEIGVGAVATIVGRYYYMDRDNRWDRVKLGYDCVFDGVGSHYTNADAGIKASYASGVLDEFVQPTVIGSYKGVKDGDSIIFYNFRSDRAREITRAAIEPDFASFERSGGYKKTFYVGMTRYDATFEGIHTAFPPKEIKNTLGQWLAALGKTQARVAETEKYAHVTFFFNGGVETPNEGETRTLVPSPKVATYDLKPEMSAFEVTEKALETIGKVDTLIMNFANCDMVGHTGVLSAAMRAVGAVDECVKKVVEAVKETGGTALVTADHGNAELMQFDDGSPCTSHSTNPVPFILAGDKYIGRKLRSGGALCDVAPTLLDVMGVPQPKEMEGKSLIEK